MAVSHRTNRLKLIGTPAVEQLQNGRYQLTVNCTTMNSREDWYSANKARIFPDFGSLESAEMSIDGLAPRTGEAYTDMRLVSVQSSTQQEKYIVTLVYQTLGASFVQVKDDTVNYVENGLRRVTRESIAKAGTDFQKTIGTTSITSQIDGETAVTCILANYEVNDTDSYREVTEVYIEAGTLSETEDKVGSQLSIVKETFASTPSTPSGYSIANEQESNVDGILTRRFTFLKNNVQLSRSVDNESSLLTEAREYFKPDSSKETLANYSLVNKAESNVDGIPTERYTFAKNNQQISKSVDNESPLKTETREYFKPDSSKETLTGYSLVNKQESNVDGIPTERYTFAKNDVILSTSEEKVGSQLAIVKEVFNGTPSTPSGYSIADESVSNVNGIVTRRFRFLKENVQLSRSVDNESSLKTEVREYFKPDSSKATLTNYSLVNKQESNVDGIPTERYTFAKNNVTLSETEDKVGGQLAIVKEVFNGTPSTPSGYSIASVQESNVDGIPTERYTFFKPNILSVQQNFNNGQKRVSVQAFSKTSAEVTSDLSEVTSDHKLISQRESDFAGIKTSTFEYQLDESFTEDRELNGLKRVSLIELSASDFTAQTIGAVSSTAPTSGLFLGSQVIDNGGTIKLRESNWFEAGTLNVSTKNLAQGVREVTTVFLVTEGSTVGPVTARSTNNFEGLKTISVTTMQDKDGNPLGTNDSTPVHSFDTFSNFTYPGLFTVALETPLSFVANINVQLTEAPVQSKVRSTVYVFFTTRSSIEASDYTYDSASGLWAPNKWGSIVVAAVGQNNNVGQFRTSKAFRGYRSSSSIIGPTLLSGQITTFLLNGAQKYSDDGNNGMIYGVTVNKGPADPVGSKWVLDVQIKSAFDDIDGATYYKKTIIVTEAIPAQASLDGGPYN